MGQRSQPLSPCLTTHCHDVLRPASLEPGASAGAIAASGPWTGRTGCAPGSGETRQPRRCAGAGGVRIQGKRPLPAGFRSRPAGDRQGEKDRTRREFHRWQDLRASPRQEKTLPASCIQEVVTLFTRPDLSTAQARKATALRDRQGHQRSRPSFTRSAQCS